MAAECPTSGGVFGTEDSAERELSKRGHQSTPHSRESGLWRRPHGFAEHMTKCGPSCVRVIAGRKEYPWRNDGALHSPHAYPANLLGGSINESSE